ncbi:MAG TPA: undecaprenyl-diphosphate phosphatase [bacterium]|nr:undecaprenyl-diphosphate phosphatase [bacterium]
MTPTQSIILGTIQGLTEFIPVSSSGHLVLIPSLLGWEQQSTGFDLVVHAGTLLALIIYFRKDLIGLSKNKKLLSNILVASTPVLAFAFIFRDFIDANLKSITVVIAMLIFFGLAMIIVDLLHKKNELKINELEPKNIVLISLIQILSLVRGTSRSGAMIVGGLTQGLTRKEAARFAFLVGVPVLLAATGFQVFSFVTEPSQELVLPLILGFLTSFSSGFFAIRFMLRFLEKNGLFLFGAYRIILGISLIFLLVK